MPAKVRPIERVHDRPRDAEYAWLREHGREYVGQWVALDGGLLVGAAHRLQDLRAQLNSADLDRDLLFHRLVPD